MQHKKRILIICPFPQGVAAGQRLKYEQYLNHWRDNGYEITISSFMDASMWKVVYTPGNYVPKVLGTLRGHCRRLRDVFRVRQYDLVYIFMWVTPFGSSLFERLYRLLSRHIVYDIEDNILLEQENGLNPLLKMFKGPGKARYLIKTSDHVVSSSPFLNDYCLGINLRKASTYISSSVNSNYFIPTNTYNNKKTVTIGWTGTFSSKEYLDLLRDVFLELNKRIDFKLRVIGNFQYDLPGVDLEVIQWRKETEVEDLQGIDIGIYPLVQDDWVLGKSGLKAIQYMAFGLPTVATNVGTTPRIIKHMTNGWLVKTDEEWIEALEELIKNPQLRQNLGEAARLTVLENYSTDVVKSTYLSILNNVTGTRS
ncbi:MAG: glycosyltransferase family 4 protein [Planktomarina sp.]|nr:glycosyltransferase family 4 protein [Planktomarina sp.]|tara:strand:+ start:699 stop:1799 length:1101 start_codon:yes stop_codon:yes gene_type:complete